MKSFARVNLLVNGLTSLIFFSAATGLSQSSLPDVVLKVPFRSGVLNQCLELQGGVLARGDSLGAGGQGVDYPFHPGAEFFSCTLDLGRAIDLGIDLKQRLVGNSYIGYATNENGTHETVGDFDVYFRNAIERGGDGSPAERRIIVEFRIARSAVLDLKPYQIAPKPTLNLSLYQNAFERYRQLIALRNGAAIYTITFVEGSSCAFNCQGA